MFFVCHMPCTTTNITLFQIIFHDPTDMGALTPSERAPYGPANTDATLTSASLTSRERVAARLYPKTTRPAPAAAAAFGATAASATTAAATSTATVPAPRGCATAEADSDDDMPPLLSPTSSESEIGDF